MSRLMLVGLLLVALAAAVPAQADDRDAIRDFLAQTEELAPLQGAVAGLQKLSAESYGGEVSIFGLTKVGLYVWIQDYKPVAALVLPSVGLSTIAPPLQHTPMDVTLDDPIVFVSKEGYLKKAQMPAPVRGRANDLGFGDAIHVDAGAFNLFGRVANRDDLLHQVLSLINLKGPLLAGYASPPGETVQTPGGDKKLRDRVLSLMLPANTPWESPFHFKHTTIRDAAIQFRRSKQTDLDPKTHLRVMGQAAIGSKNPKTYDMFVEKTFDKTAAADAAQPMLVAVNPRGEVSLADFFAVGQAVAANLGLPEQALAGGHLLPVSEIKLRNPNTPAQAFPEIGGPPDFTKVMFAGANLLADIPGGKGPLLTVNAEAKVFGFNAAKLLGTFSTMGIKAAAAVALPRLGPLEVADTTFETEIAVPQLGNPTPPPPSMRLNAKTAGLTLKVDASTAGLTFALPADCSSLPPRPTGLMFSLQGFDLSKDFSVTPQVKDCLMPIVKDLIDDGEKAATFVAGAAADAADTAADIATSAAGELAAIADSRVGAWSKAIGDKVGAQQAKAAANAAVNTLESAVGAAEAAVKSAVRKVEKLLSELWGAITGEVKRAKRDRDHKVADRDHKRTQLAAARQRLAQASQAAAEVPVPYHNDALRTAQQAELGKRAQLAQQTRLREMLPSLPDVIETDVEKRRAIFDGPKIAATVEASFSAEYRTLGELINGRKETDPATGETRVIPGFGTLTAAHQAPIPGPEAVATLAAGMAIANMKEKILQEEVAKLPTMSFNKRVLVQTVGEAAIRCLGMPTRDAGSGARLILSECTGRPEQLFIFTDTGVVVMPAVGSEVTVNIGNTKKTMRFGSSCVTSNLSVKPGCTTFLPQYASDPRVLYFFDPLDGRLRNSQGCLAHSEAGIRFIPCEKQRIVVRPGWGMPEIRTTLAPQGGGDGWRLVEPETLMAERAAAQGQVLRSTTRTAGPPDAGAAPHEVPAVTRLDPLMLH